MSLTPDQLLALDRLSSVTVADLRDRAPDLFAALSATAATERRTVVTAAFAGTSAPLRAAVSKVDFALGAEPQRELRDVLYDGLAAQRVAPELAREAAQRVLELERAGDLADPAEVSLPVGEHPLYAGELNRAAVVKVALAASLNFDLAGKLLEVAARPGDINDEAVHRLVDGRLIDAEQAAGLGLTASLYHLVGDRVEVAQGLRAGLADDGNHRDLAGVGVQGWLNAIQRGHVTPPDGLTEEQFAADLDRTVSALHPTDALLARLVPATDGLRAANNLTTAIERADPELAALANAHPGLRLHEVLAQDAPASTRATEISSRLDMVTEVRRLNPTAELLTLDYSPESPDAAALDFGSLQPEQRGMVVADLKAHQRAFALTDDVAGANALLRAGYHSALTTATAPPATLAERTGLPAERVEQIHRAARAGLAKITSGVATIVDLFHGGFPELGQDNVQPSIQEYLRKIDGFEDLFGSQDYCNCEHCRSILGPAAYFVDLMSFVEEHVLAVHFGGEHATHPLNLATRRPDLWTLPLTCENTTTLVPYLDIICEILENYIAQRDTPGIDLSDRAAVEDLVYRQRLATEVDSFDQPFMLPLERLTTYLAYRERDRGQVAWILGRPPVVRVPAALGLSRREYELVTEPETDLTALAHIYGVPFVADASGAVDPVDVGDLVRGTGRSRDDLAALAATRFVSANGTEPVEFRSEKSSPDSVQDDVERVYGLRAGSLDRLHRLARLVRVLPWSTADVDVILTHLGPADLEPATLASLVDVLTLDRRFADLPADRLCALWGPVAPIESLVDRHGRLARLLRLTVADLLRLVTLAGLDPAQPAGLGDLLSIVELHDWWRASGYTLDDLELVVGGAAVVQAHRPDPAAVAVAVVAQVRAGRELEFADTIFAFVPGVTEDQSRAILKANPSIVEATPEGTALRLTTSFDPAAPLVVPAGVTAPEPALREALVAHHVSRVLPAALAAQLGGGTAGAGSAARVTELTGMTGTDPGAPELVQALQGGPAAPLESLVRKLVPLVVLFKAKVFDADALAFIRTRAMVYGIGSFSTVALAVVRRLAVHAAFATGDEPRPDPADLRHALSTFDPIAGFAGTDPARLAALLRTDEATLATVLPPLTVPVSAPEAVTKLSAAVALAVHLGVTGEQLALMVSDGYADLTQAAAAALAGIRAAHPDEEDFARRVEPLDDEIRSRKRDALTDYLVRGLTPAQFADQSEIYQHFLVDTALEGCARTSRLVAAISSVQLYLHRVLANLEQDDREPTDPQRVAVPSSAIPADEWQWRKNYRVWEANRKVFLWPENYIEPELRDDKTPLFEELESMLLQQEVNEQTVLDAYAGYVAGLEEVAGLQIAGAFHAKDPATRTDLLHLFGVTPGEPPVYYYRTVENAHYGELDAGRGPVFHPWRKIDVQIPARRVAPVVYLGRLFLFWTEIATSPRNEVKDAGSTFVGYQHRFTVKYTTLRLNGAWSPPQRISLAGGPFSKGDGVVDDPLTDPSEQEAVLEAILDFDMRALADALRAAKTPRYDSVVHPEPIDGYSLTGFQWDRVYMQSYPDRLTLTGRNFLMRADIDFYRASIVRRFALQKRPSWQRILSVRPAHGGHGVFSWLYAGTPPEFVLEDYAAAMVMADSRRLDALAQISESRPMSTLMGPGLYQTKLANLLARPEITVVNGSISDAILDLDGDLLYVQGAVRPCWRYVVKRLGTTLGEPISRLLFTGGVDALLSTSTQLALAEKYAMIQPSSHLSYEVNSGRLDFRGSFGTYYREVFFHIPFLIANHLNGQQRFRAAQRWYHYIFDPTAAETIAIPPGTPPEEAEHRARDRVWRYSEFRNLNMPALRDILTDRAAIETYKRDPFNPHAIARLRLSAYQKCIVMKYVDNLLDWGDSLFAEFTMESVNEATMLYVLAADVLGPRPAVVGSCGEGAVTPRTYETIAPLIRNGSPFLMELENMLWQGTRAPQHYGTTTRRYDFVIDRVCVRYFAEYVGATWTLTTRVASRSDDAGDRGPRMDVRGPRTATPIERARVAADFLDDAAAEALAMRNAAAAVAEANAHSLAGGSLSRFTDWSDTFTAGWDGASARGAGTRGADIRDGGLRLIADFNRVPGFGWAVIRQMTPVFCIPPNRDLRGYWDRVEDRLYKLRHCLDLTGARRDLALFAPEIDPRMLVRAAAAGLPLAEVLDATSGDLPPYRFSYLIEKAKQHAIAVQSLGGSLLSALERKDVEEMTRLRAVHQQNLLAMTTRVREWEIDIAADSMEALRRQQAAAEYRRDFYDGLLSGGLNAGEHVQQVARHTASAAYIGGALLNGTAGLLSLLPQMGSPFAMKYGGVELSSSAKAWGAVASDTARVAEVVAASAGLEAGFSRRREGWRHQRELARRELDLLAKSITAAQARQRIAVRSLETHQREAEQLAEVFQLYGDRFSNLALYTWLSTTLQRLHREAYNSAYATARLAEQAYRLERSDETTVLLRGGYYDASKAGLAAGEQLLVDLEQMERRFLETNYRTPELDQAFSLTQIDPAALVRLRETGECEFDLPEVFFDLFYPGHYRRRIRSVRLTIPCVTGPYTNVPATLALTGSRLRRDPVLGADSLIEVPLRRSVAIATSTAQNDTGVFEFSFRDERYMPFEGAGAISSWRLSLPAAFRPFDYQTITDVIVHISYTAESDGVLRSAVEQLDATIDGTIAHYLTNNPLGRVFSLRQEFSTVLNRLLHSPTGTPVKLELTDRHLSLFLRGRDLQVSAAKLLARTAAGQGVGGLSLTLDGTAVGGLTQDPDLGGLWTADVSPALAGRLTGEHTLVVVDAGELGPENPEPGATTALDPEKLLDLAVYVELSLA